MSGADEAALDSNAFGSVADNDSSSDGDEETKGESNNPLDAANSGQ